MQEPSSQQDLYAFLLLESAEVPACFYEQPLFDDTEVTPQLIEGKCRCRLTQCRKGYCECYAGGKACNSLCGCINCHNLSTPPLKEGQSGCNCKKSQCAKNYCVCFRAGRPCSNLCHCLVCANTHQPANCQ